jgi:hypothetical protein
MRLSPVTVNEPVPGVFDPVQIQRKAPNTFPFDSTIKWKDYVEFEAQYAVVRRIPHEDLHSVVELFHSAAEAKAKFDTYDTNGIATDVYDKSLTKLYSYAPGLDFSTDFQSAVQEAFEEHIPTGLLASETDIMVATLADGSDAVTVSIEDDFTINWQQYETQTFYMAR